MESSAPAVIGPVDQVEINARRFFDAQKLCEALCSGHIGFRHNVVELKVTVFEHNRGYGSVILEEVLFTYNNLGSFPLKYTKTEMLPGLRSPRRWVKAS
jgi:hypothetical protein